MNELKEILKHVLFGIGLAAVVAAFIYAAVVISVYLSDMTSSVFGTTLLFVVFLGSFAGLAIYVLKKV